MYRYLISVFSYRYHCESILLTCSILTILEAAPKISAVNPIIDFVNQMRIQSQQSQQSKQSQQPQQPGSDPVSSATAPQPAPSIQYAQQQKQQQQQPVQPVNVQNAVNNGFNPRIQQHQQQPNASTLPVPLNGNTDSKSSQSAQRKMEAKPPNPNGPAIKSVANSGTMPLHKMEHAMYNNPQGRLDDTILDQMVAECIQKHREYYHQILNGIEAVEQETEEGAILEISVKIWEEWQADVVGLRRKINEGHFGQMVHDAATRFLDEHRKEYNVQVVPEVHPFPAGPRIGGGLTFHDPERPQQPIVSMPPKNTTNTSLVPPVAPRRQRDDVDSRGPVHPQRPVPQQNAAQRPNQQSIATKSSIHSSHDMVPPLASREKQHVVGAHDPMYSQQRLQRPQTAERTTPQRANTTLPPRITTNNSIHDMVPPLASKGKQHGIGTSIGTSIGSQGPMHQQPAQRPSTTKPTAPPHGNSVISGSMASMPLNRMEHGAYHNPQGHIDDTVLDQMVGECIQKHKGYYQPILEGVEAVGQETEEGAILEISIRIWEKWEADIATLRRKINEGHFGQIVFDAANQFLKEHREEYDPNFPSRRSPERPVSSSCSSNGSNGSSSSSSSGSSSSLPSLPAIPQTFPMNGTGGHQGMQRNASPESVDSTIPPPPTDTRM